jgi:hypothetical protein
VIWIVDNMSDQKLWVAIPDTVLSDSKNLRDKTIKLGSIARSCVIFQVNKIFFYRDNTITSGEFELIRIILEYLDTPQYLRKQLYGMKKELQYAGLLPPLRTPHHKLVEKITEIKVGGFREGIVVKNGGQNYVEVGLSNLIPVDGPASKGSRVTVRFTTQYPNLRCQVTERDKVKMYWGYEVKEATSLQKLLKSLNADISILTSRKGIPLADLWQNLVTDIQHARKILVVFGAPRSGVNEILLKDNVNPKDLSKYVLNILQEQGSATIRTEEALLGTLAILNLAKIIHNQVAF